MDETTNFDNNSDSNFEFEYPKMAVRKTVINVQGDSLKNEDDQDNWTLNELLATNEICNIKTEVTNYDGDMSDDSSVDKTTEDNTSFNGDVKTEDVYGSLSSSSSDVDPLQDNEDIIDNIAHPCLSGCKNDYKSLPSATVLKSGRGNEVFDIEGHTFRFNSMGDNGTIIVKCGLSHRFGCTANASIKKTGDSKVGLVYLNGVHNHKVAVSAGNRKKISKKSRPDLIPVSDDLPSSDVSDMQPLDSVRVLKTSEELDEYYINGYVYQCNSIRPDNLIYSLCSEARSKNCSARAKLRKNQRGHVTPVKVTGFHNHPPEFREETSMEQNRHYCPLRSPTKVSRYNLKIPIEVLQTSKGRDEYFIDGHVYLKTRTSRSGNFTRVRCSEYKRADCQSRGVVQSKGGTVILVRQNGAHNHESDLSAAMKTEAVGIMMQRLKARPESTPFSVYKQVLEESFDSKDSEVMNRFPLYKNVCYTLQRAVDQYRRDANVEANLFPNREHNSMNESLKVGGENVYHEGRRTCQTGDHSEKHAPTFQKIAKSVINGSERRWEPKLCSERIPGSEGASDRDSESKEKIDPGAVHVKILKTSKGYDEYFIEGHLFQRSCTKYGKTYVHCRSYRTGCRARGILKINGRQVAVVQVSTVHSHGPDTVAAVRAEAIGLMMQKFKNNPESTPLTIYKDVMKETFDTMDAEFKKALPSYKNVSYILNRASAKFRKEANRKRKHTAPSVADDSELISPVKILRTDRSKSEYLINGFIYHCGSVGKRGNIYVQCKNYSRKDCSARGIIKPNNGDGLTATTSGSHNHPADILGIARSEVIGKMIEKYTQYPELSPSTIYDMVIKESYDTTDPEVLNTLPTLKNVLYILRRTGTKLRKNGIGRPVRRRRIKPDTIRDSTESSPKESDPNSNDASDRRIGEPIQAKTESAATKHSVKVLQTSKGSDEYFIDGYIYQLSRTAKLGKVYLHCKNYRRNGCWGRGIVKVDGGKVSVVQISETHNHEPDTAAAIRTEALGMMIQMLKDQCDLSTLAVYNRVMSKSFDVTDAEVSSAIPSYNSVSSILRKAAVRIRGHRPDRRVNRKRNAGSAQQTTIVEENPVLETHAVLQANSSLLITEPTVKVLQTSKGKDEYFFDGYIYQLSRHKDCSSMYLQCKNYRRNGCSARGEVKREKGVVLLVRKSGTHNHGAEIPAAIRAEALRMMINKLKEHPESSPSSVYNQVMKESFDTADVMVRTAVPSYKSVSSILQKTSARLRRNMPDCPELNIKRKRTKKDKDSMKDLSEPIPRENSFNPEPLLGRESDPYSIGIDSNLGHDSYVGIDSNNESIHGPRLDAIPPLDTLSEGNSFLEPDSIQKYIIWKVSD